MLRSIHKLSESWFFKGILLITALSFMSFFGMGGLDELQNRRDAVITVGDVHVSAEDLTRKFTKEVDRVRGAVGGKFSEQEAIQMGLLQNLIGTETSRAAMQMAAYGLGVTVSPEMLRSAVFAVPEFQDENGEFNRQRFEYFLSKARMSEQAFMANLTTELLEGQILNPISGLAVAPELMVELAYQSRFEKRSVEVISVDVNKMQVSAKPSNEELLAYYDSEKEKYMEPEYRTLSVILLSYEDILDSIPVTEEQIKERYEQNKSFYVKPERRDVDQMHFAGKEAAEKALKELNSGKDFRDVAKNSAGQSEKDTNLGWVEKDGVLAEFADDLFAAGQGDIVGPVQSTMGWHVLTVLDIEPQTETPFAKVKDIIAKDIKKEIGADTVYDKANRLDDFLASGKTLEEAADTFNLKVISIPQIDITGKDAKGKSLPDMFSSPDFLETAFSLSQGNESPVTESADGFFVVRADTVKAPEAKPLSAVQKDIEALWRKDRQSETAKDRADKILTAVKEGKTLASSAKKYGLNVEKISGLSRTGSSVLPSGVVARIFALPPYEAGIVSTPAGYAVVKVDKITSPRVIKNSKETQALKAEVQERLSQRMLTDTVNAFAGMYKVKVDYNTIKKLFEVTPEADY